MKHSSYFSLPPTTYKHIHALKRTSNSQLPTPNSQLPTPNSQLPIPNSQLPTPNSQLPIPNSQLIRKSVLKMDPFLKLIIKTALNVENPSSRHIDALDELYLNLIIRPIQLAWKRNYGPYFRSGRGLRCYSYTDNCQECRGDYY